MKNITVDFQKKCGQIKPMHAVNNGPVYKFKADQRVTNMDAWKEAGIPYARLHDSAFYGTYGGPHTVDVNLIFTDFNADPYLPESYDFACTDEYLKVIDFSGTKIFYRLGASIEHWVKKYHTRPPKDFEKWAVICEHIIRHYTEGWADGFHYDIEYWEIWNEPDWGTEGDPQNATWGGTTPIFYDFYEIAAKHLKSKFPHLKIGGPASVGKVAWSREFLLEMSKRNVPIDFFSWHRYTNQPTSVVAHCNYMREAMDAAGYTDAESICDEWNYVYGWMGDEFVNSLRAIKNIKGASYTLGTICACQYANVDMLMYYDARPCAWNGMFNTDIVCDVLKGYYPFKMFNQLYKLGNSVEVVNEENLYSCAAVDGDMAAFVCTHFSDNDSTAHEDVAIQFDGFGGEKGVQASYYLLDENHNLELEDEDVFYGESYSKTLKVDLFSSYLVILKKL